MVLDALDVLDVMSVPVSYCYGASEGCIIILEVFLSHPLKALWVKATSCCLEDVVFVKKGLLVCYLLLVMRLVQLLIQVVDLVRQ